MADNINIDVTPIIREVAIEVSQAIKGDDGVDGTNGTDGIDGVVQSIQAGTNIVIDDTDVANPIVNTLAEPNTIDSEPIGNEAQVLQVVSMTQANYDLITPVATTFYIITE